MLFRAKNFLAFTGCVTAISMARVRDINTAQNNRGLVNGLSAVPAKAGI
jgi:hypothetical protein